MNPIEVVREFCDAFGAKDMDRMRAVLADDVVWHNVGTPVMNGIDELVDFVETKLFAAFTEIEFRITSIAADGDAVLTERVDTLIANGTVAAIPLMGIFEVSDGRITAWRDYIDQALVGKYLSGEPIGDLAPTL